MSWIWWIGLTEFECAQLCYWSPTHPRHTLLVNYQIFWEAFAFFKILTAAGPTQLDCHTDVQLQTYSTAAMAHSQYNSIKVLTWVDALHCFAPCQRKPCQGYWPTFIKTSMNVFCFSLFGPKISSSLVTHRQAVSLWVVKICESRCNWTFVSRVADNSQRESKPSSPTAS